ncbi:MAG: phosphoenolpyruvate carboxykinase (GTP) [Candidatus Izemoplasmatales bacterium]|jgi:phosphoenolpyruvate carboxykinase (GTP)|nr:phosphoenolpyruvate carboxykinase (GTP) [Candidatus Izemoplasmatales bacterium]MDD4987515.1 phosphoenolpyruvate carboxykinase (GTP) [Candidatus Izemoplasmatales bacterium]MDY0372744.1 phosphoenolpyruvate carboxykinase (GTP) [Candidatus Izemoplasmatales bacterium]
MYSRKLLDWIHEVELLCQPDQTVWWHGTQQEYDALLEDLVIKKKAIRLNPKLRPGCVLFRTDPSDVARVEQRTFISSKRKEDAGPTNNWVSPETMKATMLEYYQGSMRGRTLYVIPFSMGPLGSSFSKIGVELTDSAYVTANMHIMTRTGDSVLDLMTEDTEFVKCLHSVGYPLSKGDIDPLWPCAPIEQKFITQFPEDNMIWSYGSGYGGNALLGKKCFALRIASYQAKNEKWLAEHMLILKLISPEGVIRYVTGAFPSACGKTNLAMIHPSLPGWKAETVGDDIAWLRFKDDGRLYAINPEAGFFGVASGTSWKSNPNAMATIAKDTIFTNVALTDDGDVWWEDMTDQAPAHLIDWQGNDWTPSSQKKAAHPNCRFTAPAKNCPSIAPNWEDPEGVPISAILFGGRRPSTIPLVIESFDFNHGVFLGSIMGSEITAATISDDIGKVRRDPFAMLPFIGYHISDYINHWLEMGQLTQPEKLPKIYFVNWFRKDENGHYLWPGFGENIRVLEWILSRTDQDKNGITTPVGILPDPAQFNLKGCSIDPVAYKTLFSVDSSAWEEEIRSIEQHQKIYGDRLPEELKKQLMELKQRFHS